jgi:hypothetical protein
MGYECSDSGAPSKAAQARRKERARRRCVHSKVQRRVASVVLELEVGVVLRHLLQHVHAPVPAGLRTRAAPTHVMGAPDRRCDGSGPCIACLTAARRAAHPVHGGVADGVLGVGVVLGRPSAELLDVARLEPLAPRRLDLHLCVLCTRGHCRRWASARPWYPWATSALCAPGRRPAHARCRRRHAVHRSAILAALCSVAPEGEGAPLSHWRPRVSARRRERALVSVAARRTAAVSPRERRPPALRPRPMAQGRPPRLARQAAAVRALPPRLRSPPAPRAACRLRRSKVDNGRAPPADSRTTSGGDLQRGHSLLVAQIRIGAPVHQKLDACC